MVNVFIVAVLYFISYMITCFIVRLSWIFMFTCWSHYKVKKKTYHCLLLFLLFL